MLKGFADDNQNYKVAMLEILTIIGAYTPLMEAEARSTSHQLQFDCVQRFQSSIVRDRPLQRTPHRPRTTLSFITSFATHS